MPIQEARNSIRQWLANAALKPRTRLPSERKLATLLGLKHTTVNRAVALLIEEGAIVREGYKLLIPAPSHSNLLAKGRTTFDLVVFGSPYLIRDFRRTARELGVDLRVHPWETSDEFVTILDKLDSNQITGVLIKPPFRSECSMWQSAVGRLKERGIQCVTISECAHECPSVIADDTRALEQIFDRLEEFGHRDVALTMLPLSNSRSEEMGRHWISQCHRHGFGKSSGRILHQRTSLEERAREVADMLKKSWKPVTALVLGDCSLAGPLLARLKETGIKVPEDLSIVSIGDSNDFLDRQESVTCVSYSGDGMVEAAFHLLKRAVRKKEQTGKLLLGEGFRMETRWVDKQSLAKIQSVSKSCSEPPFQAGWEGPPRLNLEADPNRRQLQIAKMTYAAFPFASKHHSATVQPLDLSPYLNRPLQYRRGWLGDRPLSKLDPGEHLFHSVPFHIAGGATQSDCGAIIFRSRRNSTGKGAPLPEVIRIPVHRPALAIYFLHGCGWSEYLFRFATYVIHGRKKILGEVPLIALGEPPSGITAAKWEQESKKANIQDWWPEFPHVDFPTARRVPILGCEQQPSVRFLYTLEWINPRPAESVESIEIRVNANVATTLGLLAVSVL